MGVLFGSFLMFSSFYQLDPHNEACVALAIYNDGRQKKIGFLNLTCFFSYVF